MQPQHQELHYLTRGDKEEYWRVPTSKEAERRFTKRYGRGNFIAIPVSSINFVRANDMDSGYKTLPLTGDICGYLPFVKPGIVRHEI